MSRTTSVTVVAEDDAEEGRLHVLHDMQLPDYVTVFRVSGPLLFGATENLTEVADRAHTLPPIVILKLRHVTAMDATGLRALEDVADGLRKSGRALIVCGAQPQPAALMDSSDFHHHVGVANICANTKVALARAEELHRSRRSVA